MLAAFGSTAVDICVDEGLRHKISRLRFLLLVGRWRVGLGRRERGSAMSNVAATRCFYLIRSQHDYILMYL